MTANSVHPGNGTNQSTYVDPQTGYVYTVDPATGQSVWVTDPVTGQPVKGQQNAQSKAPVQPVVEQPVQPVAEQPVVEQSVQPVGEQPVQTDGLDQPVSESVPSFDAAQAQAPFQAYTSQPFYDNPRDANVASAGPEFANIPTPQPSSGLAIGALVLGILALLLSFIPVINIGSYIMGLIGIILGIVGIVKASKGTARGKGMAIAGIILSLLAFALGTFMNAAFVSVLDEEGYLNELDTYYSSSSSDQVSIVGSNTDAQSDAGATAADAKTYKMGETWTVDGQWELTIKGVKATDERNEYADQNPQAVYIVDYTYTNLGYEDKSGIFDGLMLFVDETVVDAGGKLGYTYPGDVAAYPQETPVGATCDAQVCIGVENPGSFKLMVSQYDSDDNRQKAIFEVEV